MTGPQPQPDPENPVKVYLESRYRKLERGLPQTIFYCPVCKGDRRRSRLCKRCEGFGKLTRDSVQELIGRVAVPHLRGKRGRFHGAGREDLDVLMLGQGRPFVFEVVGAREPDADLTELDAKVRERYAGRIELRPFRRVERSRVPYWKEAKFDKIYRVEVGIQGDAPEHLPPGADLVGRSIDIVQRTPSRVAHRRADIERQRRVTILAVGPLRGDSFTVEIRCTHGTYVKEWVSGEDGRTQPSLAELLGIPSRCLTLDVLEILTEEADGSGSPEATGDTP